MKTLDVRNASKSLAENHSCSPVRSEERKRILAGRGQKRLGRGNCFYQIKDSCRARPQTKEEPQHLTPRQNPGLNSIPGVNSRIWKFKGAECTASPVPASVEPHTRREDPRRATCGIRIFYGLERLCFPPGRYAKFWLEPVNLASNN